MICRRIIVSVLAVLWLSAPLLACLPNSSMTAEEMECCKKMAGNCDMGGGNHKCCDKTVNHSAPEAAVLHSSAPDLHLVFVAAPLVQPVVFTPQAANGTYPAFAPQSPPPLVLTAVLRI